MLCSVLPPGAYFGKHTHLHYNQTSPSQNAAQAMHCLTHKQTVGCAASVSVSVTITQQCQSHCHTTVSVSHNSATVTQQCLCHCHTTVSVSRKCHCHTTVSLCHKSVTMTLTLLCDTTVSVIVTQKCQRHCHTIQSLACRTGVYMGMLFQLGLPQIMYMLCAWQRRPHLSVHQNVRKKQIYI